MPVFEAITQIACTPQAAFDFIANPANLLRVTPPEMHIELLDVPARIALGAKIKARASRYGIKQTIVNEVTAFQEGVGFTDAQIEGPFQKLVHTHLVVAHDGGTQLTDRFDFEGPGGVIGWVLTNDRILDELKTLAAYRTMKYREHLER